MALTVVDVAVVDVFYVKRVQTTVANKGCMAIYSSSTRNQMGRIFNRHVVASFVRSLE